MYFVGRCMVGASLQVCGTCCMLRAFVCWSRTCWLYMRWGCGVGYIGVEIVVLGI
jgi:hypothetical protein